MTTFTASEVRRLSNRIPHSNDEIADAQEALRAFADMLEADEKVVPAAYAQFTDGGCIRMWSRQYEERLLGTRMIPLYTHPAPADAERSAEALRELKSIASQLPALATKKDVLLRLERAERIAAKLNSIATHSIQAQPPAASVTDEMVERARSAFVRADDGSTGITDAIRAALLAALENPNG